MLFPKPVTELIHRTGDWTVRLLLLSLLVTPLRRFARWPKLIAIRRMVGVAAFAYALAHFSLYVVDQSYNLFHVAQRNRAALLPDDRFRRAARPCDARGDLDRRDDPPLGALNWNRLHKLVYLIAPLALLHFFLQAKANVAEPAMMTGLFFLLMLARFLTRFGWPQWACALASALIAAPATALAEASWYAFVRHIPFARVWDANFSLLLAPRPSWLVAAAGVALVVVTLARLARPLHRAARGSRPPLRRGGSAQRPPSSSPASAVEGLLLRLALRNRNGATSATPGGLSTSNGAGRQTAIADRPTRAVSRPLSTPSPSRAEMREATPWPTTCCSRLSPTAMPPVIARCAPIERSSAKKPNRPGRPP